MRGWKHIFRVGSALTPSGAEALRLIPGVEVKLPDQTGYAWTVWAPWHAGFIVDEQLRAWGVGYHLAAHTPVPQIEGVPANRVIAADQIPGVKQHGVKPLTEFQVEGLAFFQERMGGLAHWECVDGKATIIVNRGGCARPMTLEDLHDKFNGIDGRWRKDIETKIPCMAPDGTVVSGVVGAIWDSGQQPTWKVVTRAGTSLVATRGHVFLTPSGPRTLGELQVGDQVLVRTRPPGKGRGLQRLGTRESYRVVTAMHNHPHATSWWRTRKDRPNPDRLSTVPRHRVVYEAHLNGLTTEAFVARVKGGDLTGLVFIDPQVHEVHHRDRDPSNNTVANLELLDKIGHRQHHAQEDGAKNVLFRATPTDITAIEPMGTRWVYDIAMKGPHHNFVANNIVVHNCGSGKTRLGILWALSTPGRTLVITRSSTVPQWRGEVAKWFEPGAVPVECIEGTQGYRVEHEPPPTALWAKLLVPGDEALERLDLEIGPRLGVSWSKRWRPSKVHEVVDVLRVSPAAGLDPAVLRRLSAAGLVKTWEVPTDPEHLPWRVVSLGTGRALLAYADEETALKARTALVGRAPDVSHETRVLVVGWAVLSSRRLSLLKWAPDSVVVDECFTGSAPVLTENGWLPIRQVEPGVRVLSKGPDGVLSWKPVLRHMVKPRRVGLVEVMLEDGTTLPPCTGNHQIWTVEEGYVAADQLRDRHHLLRVQSNGVGVEPVQVSGIWLYRPPQADDALVHDLEVADNHNYFCGGFLVSNSHRGKATSRWEATVQPDNSVRYLLKPNASASAMLLCHAAKRVQLLTATPSPDRTRDFWAQGDLYDPQGFARSFKIFGDRYCDGHLDEWERYDSKGTTNPGELGKRFGFFTHHVDKKRSHASLPPLIRQITYLEPSDLGHVRAAGLPKGAGANAVLEARSQIAAEAKRPYLVDRAVDLALEDGKRVCVITGTHAAVERIGAEIEARIKGKVKLWVSHGGIHGAAARQALVKNEIEPHPGPWILVGTLDAWGEAIDGLQKTQRVLCGYIPWNLALQQFEGRFSRHGSEESCLLEYVLARYTVDEPILDQVLAKAEAAGAVLPAETLGQIADSLSGTDQREDLLEALAARLLAAADNLEAGWIEAVEARAAVPVSAELLAELSDLDDPEAESEESDEEGIDVADV